MKNEKKLILLGIGTILCILGSLVLCYLDKSGWGWFLFIGLLLGGSTYDVGNNKKQ